MIRELDNEEFPKPHNLHDGHINAGLLELSRSKINRPLTQAEIAFVCGVGKARIQQIEKRAMAKLRKRLGDCL